MTWDWYNEEHLHSAIRFVTPNARHGGIDRETLATRATLYATSRVQNPQRWSEKNPKLATCRTSLAQPRKRN
jgi:hypothetical protein